MPELATVVWLIGGVIALAISCLIAERAGGNRRARPWGFPTCEVDRWLEA